MTAKKKVNKLKITQVRSVIRRPENQKRTIVALGIRRMHQTVIHDDTQQMRGMLRKVEHLVEIEEV